MGGYVGLLLGFSILQIPELLLQAFDKVKRLYEDRLKAHSTDIMGPMTVTQVGAEQVTFSGIIAKRDQELEQSDAYVN